MSRVKCFAGLFAAVVAAAPVTLLLPVTGWAQGIEEIVVTTRRKSESLQEVPIAVTAIGAEAIARQGIANVGDVAKLDPSVQFDTSYGPADTRVAIRGLSNTRGRSNVAFLIDGIDVTTENFIAAGSGLLANQRLLSDVERIEIVKGPQSALFGRAAFAGAISYTTKEPSDVFEANVRADVGDYGKTQFSGSASGPITDTMGLRADAVVWSEDGYYTNDYTGNKVGGGEGYGMSGVYVWEPNDVFKLKARASYSDDNYDVRPNYHMKSTKLITIPKQAYAADGWNYDDVVPDAWNYQPGDDEGGANINNSTFATYLSRWKPYCPDRPEFAIDPNQPYDNNFAEPGFCVPENMGNYKGNSINLDGSPIDKTKDNTGVDSQLLRASLNLDYNLDWGTFTYAGGYTTQDSWTSLDQDYQAYELSHQQGDYGNTTTQLSQEIRFASNWEGPVQATVGFLYWKERRRTEDKNFIIGCTQTVDTDKANGGGTIEFNNPGGCDGSESYQADPGIKGETLAPGSENGLWRDYWLQYGDNPGDGIAPTYWKANTDHKSIYGAINWDISEKWKLTLEDRYVEEDFRMKKPNQSSCTALAIGSGGLNFPIGGATTASQAALWKEGATQYGQADFGGGLPFGFIPEADWEALCSWQTSGQTGTNSWAYIEGETTSKYHTPKVTLEWFTNDDAMIYTSVGKAQKPGGINQLSGGGSAAKIENERFLPEKMTAYEIGTKTSWEAGGALQVNGAMFFQDYTDKQISTQQVDESGQLKPVVTNAGGAEVWGLEVDATWLPKWIDGLTLSGSYTFLNAKYTKWNVDVRSLYNTGRAGQCNVVENSEFDPNTSGSGVDPRFCNINFAGNSLERQPKNAFVGQFNYTRDLGNTGMEWFVEGNSNYQGKRWIDAENSTYFKSYWMHDLRFGLLADRWDALVYITNVFDDDTIKTGGSGPDFASQVRNMGFLAGFGVNHYFATAPDPRVIGVRASYNFGGN